MVNSVKNSIPPVGIGDFANLYKSFVVGQMVDRYKIGNLHMVPKIEKIVVSMRCSSSESSDRKALDAAMKELSFITGQYPAYSVAKKSISGFKLREGQKIGAICTLRRNLAYSFMERLSYLYLYRVRDFKGISSSSFDKLFNLSFGVSDHLIFNELNYDTIYKPRGLDVTIVIKNVSSKEMAVDFLRCFSFPIKIS